MKEHYRKMFAYNAWANKLFINCLAQPTIANAKNFLLMSHILTAEEIWHCRLTGLNAPLEDMWKEVSVEELQQKLEERNQAWDTYLEGCGSAGLATSIHYRNSKGHKFATEVSDVLNHVINHSTYHRAQIGSLLRLESVEPPVTDYIFYVRQQQEAQNSKLNSSTINQ